VASAAAAGKPAGASLSDLTLLGTARGSARETFALILRNSSREERVFRPGDTVFDLGRLSAVQKESVTIMVNGQPTQLATPDATGAAAGESAPHQQALPVQGRLASQVAEGSYVIDQQALNASLDNIGKAMTDARLLPSMKDGKVEGFRLSEVKPAGIFGMVGLKNGDVLLRINDFPIDSPDKAIQSLLTLKGQNRIKLDMIREGQPQTYSYDIR
jgi:general secretion pathway protein C